MICKQLAIIGTTASGKSALAIELASKYGGVILSLDSLSIYKEVDIASAKPTPKERGSIPHIGIDELCINEHFDVTLFGFLYKKAYKLAREKSVPLLIVGGTSFYLKTLIEGISPMPSIDDEVKREVRKLLQDIGSAYVMLTKIDPVSAAKIKPKDRYRIEKLMTLYLTTKMAPSKWFEKHPPTPIIAEPLAIYEIVWERSKLKERIKVRTKQMLKLGLIDEVACLEQRYGRSPNAMKAIGIKETLAYLDGKLDKRELFEKIITNTMRLAKRQRTFNRMQLPITTRKTLKELKDELQRELAR